MHSSNFYSLFTTGSPELPLEGVRSIHKNVTIGKITLGSGLLLMNEYRQLWYAQTFFKLAEYNSYDVTKNR